MESYSVDVAGSVGHKDSTFLTNGLPATMHSSDPILPESDPDFPGRR
ncbi:hypothetical protein QBE55_08055 [Eubacteriales bacterium mix99]